MTDLSFVINCNYLPFRLIAISTLIILQAGLARGHRPRHRLRLDQHHGGRSAADGSLPEAAARGHQGRGSSRPKSSSQINLDLLFSLSYLRLAFNF